MSAPEPTSSATTRSATERSRIRRFVLTTHRANGEEGHTDGMKLDVEGNIYVAGPGGVWIVAPDGRHLGTIRFPSVANVAFGDANGKTLYIMARRDLYRIRTKVGGHMPGPVSADSAEEKGMSPEEADRACHP